MTEPGGNEPQSPNEPQPPYGQQPPPPSYDPPAYEAPQAPQAPPPPGYASYGAQPTPPAPYGTPMGQPGAPYGVHPLTGAPYSDKTKLIAGLLQILVPFGVGRFYTGHTSIGVAQLLVGLLTCGIGCLWSVIDGIMMLVGEPTDAHGRPLKPS